MPLMLQQCFPLISFPFPRVAAWSDNDELLDSKDFRLPPGPLLDFVGLGAGGGGVAGRGGGGVLSGGWLCWVGAMGAGGRQPTIGQQGLLTSTTLPLQLTKASLTRPPKCP